VESVVVLRPPGSIRDASLDSTGDRAVTVGQSGVQVWDVARRRLLATVDPVRPIADARLSRDGKLLATASQRGPVELWDVPTGKRLLGFRVSRDASVGASSVSFSPNGRLLLTTHSDGSARLWRDGNLLTTIRSERFGFHDAEFWPDGRRIVTASGDLTAQIRDAGSGRVLVVLRGHLGPVRRAAFSRDGKYVVTTSDDATARVWDASTGESLAQLIGHTGPVRDASFSPGGKFVVTAGDTTARLWDARQGRSLAVLRGHGDFVLSATFTKDGRRVVTTSSDGTVRVWNADPKVVVLSGHTDRLNSAALNPDAGRVVTASDDRTLRIWQSSSSRELHQLRIPPGMVEGRWLPSSPFVDAVFSRDGDIVAGVRRTGAAIWDARSGMFLRALPVVGDPFSAEHVTSLDLNPDGTRLVAGTTRQVSIWAVRPSLSGAAALRSHTGAVLGVRYSEDGTQIVTAGRDGTVRIFDAATLRQRRQIRGVAPFNAAAFSPDGTRIAAASADDTARIFDASNGRELLVLRGHGGAVNDVDFNPDGTLLVTASDDKSARVWGCPYGPAGRRPARAHRCGADSPVRAVGGNTIVTASRDGTARLYPRESFLPFAQLTDIADRQAAVPLTRQERREFDVLRRD
jgi:WD40 repeat protein